MPLPKLSGSMLSELQLQFSGSAEKLPDLPTGPDEAMSSCTGSGFSFRIRPPDAAELDLDNTGCRGLEGRAKLKGRRLRRVAEGEEEAVDRGETGEDGGGVFRRFRGRAQGKPLLEMISFSVSIGEPLTDHSVMPI